MFVDTKCHDSKGYPGWTCFALYPCQSFTSALKSVSSKSVHIWCNTPAASVEPSLAWPSPSKTNFAATSDLLTSPTLAYMVICMVPPNGLKPSYVPFFASSIALLNITWACTERRWWRQAMTERLGLPWQPLRARTRTTKVPPIFNEAAYAALHADRFDEVTFYTTTRPCLKSMRKLSRLRRWCWNVKRPQSYTGRYSTMTMLSFQRKLHIELWRISGM